MISSFPHRLLSAVFQSAVVLFEHLPPFVAAVVFFAAVVAVVTVSVAVPWQTARLVVRMWRRAAGRRALAELNREYAALCATYSLDGPADASDAEYLPSMTRIGPASSTPVRPAFTRRRIAGLHIPRRHVRRHTTTKTKS